jgi:hypothetical protein
MAVEHLMDAAEGALKKKDKNITAEIVDALCSFAIHYGALKGNLFPYWFRVPLWLRQSPDFLTLSDQAMDGLKERRTWMEWKILKQYETLFTAALKWMKELSYHIAMDTRIIAQAAAERWSSDDKKI